ncbi:DUF262 domain-containing protein [Leptolyngbya sp. 7M]|uniref:DUF262 domain-containing protein n=1 Tax=Leptolyngbya sp. 7M TaxID=2812896 RepID=UPI001B8D1BB2|nr:DUF262 domain-containing protein [Leptolyngbya sp. 7M]QYO63135.1 DUF262 domain-containing HNH endonuclease family protein [Leptolyngbya sp. 7M]
MELHAYTRTISDLFSVKKRYVVPRFQREYSWTKEQVTELWDDIVSNITINSDGSFSHEEYFIGSLVLVGDDKSVALQIVDGQQRLTTLTILLSVLCERFRGIGKENVALSIYENYIAGKDDEGNYYFKLENETPKPFFQTTIQHIEKENNSPSSEEEKTLLNSYNEFYLSTSKENLRSKFSIFKIDDDLYEKLLKAIRDQVVKYLKVIFITVSEEDEAYTIFETLNARGMNLSFVDLIKNKVFKGLIGKHPDDFAKTKWKELRSIIVSRDGVGSLETFVRHWWISRYSYVSAENVYKSFKKQWNSGSIDAKTFVDELVGDAKLYVKTSSPILEDFKQQEEKELYRSLSALKTFNITQQRPFILNLFRVREKGYLKLSEVKEILSFIEKFHFLFNAVCSMRPSGIEGSYSKAARQLFEAKDKNSTKKVLAELKQQLVTRLPDRDLFKEKFSKLRFLKGYTKDKRLIQYIFSYLESTKQTTREFMPDSITLEHILPQSFGAEDYVGSIGNLLPLGQELNEEAGNKELVDKMNIYKKSNFKLTQEFAESNVTNWSKEEIKNRTIELAEYCYDSIQNSLNLKA